ncbi:MAG: DUF4082 domain-containing protein [Saprospiraceae bacterium]|nr:DUF4082 domain-containing protein [Saprospiraceae bacterium]
MNKLVRPLAVFLLLFVVCFYVPLIAQNPIVTENALSGNPPSEWELPSPNAGDLSIQGFADGLSVNKGETVRFKIDVTGAATDYTIKIYRLGYYGGDGARLVADLGTFTGVAQPAPATDPVTGLVDCGTWAESANWAVPSGAVSGIYIAKLTRLDNNGASHIAFIVRDDEGNADLLFKTMDATWQAYNGYGGNSFYTGSVPGFPNGHAAKISYNRPFLTRGGGGGSSSSEDWLFNAEYPMIRFLERNGYHVSYTTDLDMERDPDPIDTDHKVILSVGHDEYWSAAERTKFENARNAGVHLAFFSGNEVYWKTRWENSIDGNNDPVRTLVCYKEGTLGENVCGNKCDPEVNIWTGLWRDGCAFSPPADGCNPENALTGQISWDGTTGPIRVPDAFKDLRFWRNTPNVSTLGNGQTWTMPDGTLGYEWNWEQAAYESSNPRGRILMSSTLQNGHTHKLSLYRHSSGAYVFGAGTVQWSWGLDEVHDRGNEPTSPDMQQATINLFADMGVQPATLMAGLVAATASTDVDPPSAVITTPLDGEIFPNNSNVTISGTASDAGGGVVAGVEVSVDGGTTWQVATGTTNWTYAWVPTVEATYVIKSRAFDDTGNMETPDTPPAANAITVEISGALPCPCSLFLPSNTPAIPLENDNNGGIVNGMRFRAAEDGFITGVRFYKGAGNTGNHVGQLWTNNGSLLATVDFENETASGWQEQAFANPQAIVANTTYVISVFNDNGNYAVTDPYFTSAVVNGPLRGLADGEDGPNGVYLYTNTPAFPTQTFNASNYWVDVVFETNVGPDETPPTVSSTVPGAGASGVNINANVSATFNEAIDPATVNSNTVELLDPSNMSVPATISYNVGTRTAIIDPISALEYSTTYTARIVGGGTDPRIKDLAGNALAADYTWTFTTSAPPPPPPSEGPGGPILVVSSAANPFSRYPVEFLRTEGFNEFFAADISEVDATMLNGYDVVILGEMALSGTQVTLFSNWVDAGGTFIAFRPDAQLSTLLGITSAGGTLSEGYLLVNTASGPGVGIVGQTIQFHGTADQYNLNGATSLATLYSNANTATSFPAATLREVGANGGKAVAFTYDLARSVVLTRQGNPAWAGQNRETTDGVIRSNDLFFGNAAGDPQPDWVNLDKVAIPQADEQLRLLSNIIIQGNLHRKPLPRFWFLPSGFKAAVVMTGDDHGVGLTSSFFNDFLAASSGNTPADVANWTAVRGSSYIYPNTPLPGADTYQSQGFEVSVHVSTGCANWTPATLPNFFANDLTAFANNFPNINPPATHRTHCIAWSDFVSKALVQVANGIRLDVNYYYWPGSWVQDRAGMFTGSGLPMRFADEDGNLIDCYQVATQFTDESGQNFPSHHQQVIDKAVGSEGYYGVFCANFHTDRESSRALAAGLISHAQANNVPVVSAKQMLDWLDGRNGSSFGAITWNVNELSFDIAVGANANNLRGMVPVVSAVGTLLGITRNGGAVSYTTEVIKGIEYAFFPADAGAYIATYGVDVTPPEITSVTATPNANGTEATVTWNTNESANSLVQYGTNPNNLNMSGSNAAPTLSHSILLTGLTPGTLYYYRVTSEDGVGNSATEPEPPAAPLSFVTPLGPCAVDGTFAQFSLGTPDANTLVVPDGDGAVILNPAVNEEFDGVATPAGWTDGAWGGGGTVVVGGGTVTVNGAHLATNATYGPGTSIEFEATFLAGPFQNVGFSTDFDFNSPWVTIGTGSGGDGVYARRDGAADVSLGAGLLGSTHRYKIVWTATNFEFYVDGANTPAATIAYTVGTNMVAQISDFPVGGQALAVNRIRISPYPAAGSFTSQVHDAGEQRNWEQASWTEKLPTGTVLQIFQRQGDTPTPDGTWTAFSAIPSNGANIGGTSRYIQYRADLSTSNAAHTPVLEGIVFACSPVTGIPQHIRVKGNGVEIANRALTVSLADHTDFGSANVSGSTISRTFTIENVPNALSLNLTGVPLVTIADRNALDFTVTAQPSTPIAGGGSTTFTIEFDPSAQGLRSAIVIITHDDFPGNPFVFTINGTGTGL